MILLINSLAHFLVDALCASTLFGKISGDGGFVPMLLLYNTLAFSSQCLVGLALDRVKSQALFSSAAMLSVIAGAMLPIPALWRVVLIGFGNSVFHVASGVMTLRASGSRAAPLGVFVAPGALGLTLGTLAPMLGKYFALLLFFAAILLLIADDNKKYAGFSLETCRVLRAKGEVGALIPLLLLTFAVAVRAFGGSVVHFEWQKGRVFAVALTVSVMLGKLLGGYLLDRAGTKRAAWLSIPVAAALITLCSSWMIPSLIGQFALNLTMPVTLYLMYRLIPDRPGFAFGLAASALWPGTLFGRLAAPSGAALYVLIPISFLFGLVAIIYSEEVLKLKKVERK